MKLPDVLRWGGVGSRPDSQGRELNYLGKLLCAGHSVRYFTCFSLFDCMRALWGTNYLCWVAQDVEAQRWSDLAKASKLVCSWAKMGIQIRLPACVGPSLPHCYLFIWIPLSPHWLPSLTAIKVGCLWYHPSFGQQPFLSIMLQSGSSKHFWEIFSSICNSQ